MGTVRLKNVYGEPSKQSYRDLKLSPKPTAFSGGMAASNKLIAFPWEVGGGGLISLIDLEKLGRDSGNGRVNLRGHTGALQDMVFNDFDYNVLASASDDCSVKVWHVPTEQDATFKANLTGHTKKTTNVVWNSATDFVLLSGSLDNTVRVWNVECESEVLSVNVDGQYSYCNWSYDGEVILTATKEASVLLIDPRDGTTSHSFKAHESNKATSVVMLGGNYGKDHLATTGYVGNQTRQIRVWDTRNTAEPLISKDIDSSPGALIPHWDSATGLLTVVGKGDLTVRIFQYFENDLNRAGEIKCAGTIKSFCFVPHVACDKSKCELGRLLYNTNGKEVNPTSVVVMRRNTEAAMGEIYGSLRPRRRTLASDWHANNLTSTLTSACESLEADASSALTATPVPEAELTPAGRAFVDVFKAFSMMNMRHRPSFTDVSLIGELEGLKDNVDKVLALLREMHHVEAPAPKAVELPLPAAKAPEVAAAASPAPTPAAACAAVAEAAAAEVTTPIASKAVTPTPTPAPTPATEVAAAKAADPKSVAAGDATPLSAEDVQAPGTLGAAPPMEVRGRLSGVKAAIAAMEAHAQAHAQAQASLHVPASKH